MSSYYHQTPKQSFWGKFFSFSGRINRLAFFLRLLVIFAIFIVVTLMGVFFAIAIPNAMSTGQSGSGFVVLALLFALIGVPLLITGLIANISLFVRRLHDLNHSGLWYIAIFIINNLGGFNAQGELNTLGTISSLISLGILLYLLFAPGSKGPNNFGPDPLGHADNYIDEVFGENTGNYYALPKANQDTDYAKANICGRR